MEQDTVFAFAENVAEVSQDDRIDTGTICKHCAESVGTRELVFDTRPARFSANRSNMNHIDLMKALKLRDRRARRLTQGYLVLKHLGRQDW